MSGFSGIHNRLKSGTIHQAAKEYAGWACRTYNLTAKQTLDHITAIIEANCSDQEKVKRWQAYEGERLVSAIYLKEDQRREIEDQRGVFGSTNRRMQVVSSAKTKKIKWFWEGMLHRNKLNILAGDSGSNKTTFALRIASMITRGIQFPDTKKKYRPRKVLIITGEDDLEDTIKPRLALAGADLSLCYFTDRHYDFNSNGIGILKKDIKKINNEKGPKVGMVIIDPVDSYVGNANSNQGSVVKKICGDINVLAKDMKSTILGIMHFKKVKLNGEETLKNSISGSYGWVSTPRCSLVMITDPLDAAVKYLGPVKNNNASIELHYRITLQVESDNISVFIGERESLKIEMKAIQMFKQKSSITRKRIAIDLYNHLLEKGKADIDTVAAKLLLEDMGHSKKAVAESLKTYFGAVQPNGQSRYQYRLADYKGQK